MTRGRGLHWIWVAVAIVVISIMHYLIPPSQGLYHLISRELYLLPIFMAAFWYGAWGGLLSALVISVVYLPSFYRPYEQMDLHLIANIMQVGVFLVLGIIFGLMRDRDLRLQREQRRDAGLAAMGKAVSSIAHDLKSPLMAVGGFIMQVKRKLDPGDPALRKLDIAIEQVSRMESMVKDMLAFARPLELRREPTDPRQLLDNVAEVARAAAPGSVDIEVESGQDLPHIDLDKDRMQQALLNLIINAMQASPDGTPVKVIAKVKDNELDIEVRDHGSGIPQEKQTELFTPFVTTKKEGTGLGLPITKKVVEAHGGTLQLKETSPSGTVFAVRLPIQPGSTH